MVFTFTSATEQDSGRKDTAQSVARCQYQEGGLVKWDVSAPFCKRTKQQQRHKRPSFVDAKQRNLPQLIQLVRTTDLPADQDPGHRRCGAPIYHHLCVSRLVFLVLPPTTDFVKKIKTDRRRCICKRRWKRCVGNGGFSQRSTRSCCRI